MKHRILSITLLLIASGGTIAVAQPPIPKPDQYGDYPSNGAPIQGPVPPDSKLSPGSLWEVISPELNCRRKPDINSPPVRQFKSGDRLQAEVYRGGSDEVLINAKDTKGKPWMHVRSKTFKLEDGCYVRANRRHVKPVTQGSEIAVVRGLTMGDRACYMELEYAQGQISQEEASFELCQQEQLIGQQVQLTRVPTSIMAMSCQGDIECTERDIVNLITVAEVIPSGG
jgi:hypothetical protein